MVYVIKWCFIDVLGHDSDILVRRGGRRIYLFFFACGGALVMHATILVYAMKFVWDVSANLFAVDGWETRIFIDAFEIFSLHCE